MLIIFMCDVTIYDIENSHTNGSLDKKKTVLTYDGCNFVWNEDNYSSGDFDNNK